MAFLIPDYCFETVYDISPEFLLENGLHPGAVHGILKDLPEEH